MGFSALAIADRVGHESIDITYRYAHLFPNKQTEMADKLDMERMESLTQTDNCTVIQFHMDKEFEPYGEVFRATEDGSAGIRGNVLDVITGRGLSAEVIMACGPTPMLRALKTYAADHGMECYLSLEEKMACGVGARLACVCQTKHVDHHSNVCNARICKDGPVFAAEEVEL